MSPKALKKSENDYYQPKNKSPRNSGTTTEYRVKISDGNKRQSLIYEASVKPNIPKSSTETNIKSLTTPKSPLYERLIESSAATTPGVENENNGVNSEITEGESIVYRRNTTQENVFSRGSSCEKVLSERNSIGNNSVQDQSILYRDNTSKSNINSSPGNVSSHNVASHNISLHNISSQNNVSSQGNPSSLANIVSSQDIITISSQGNNILSQDNTISSHSQTNTSPHKNRIDPEYSTDHIQNQEIVENKMGNPVVNDLQKKYEIVMSPNVKEKPLENVLTTISITYKSPKKIVKCSDQIYEDVLNKTEKAGVPTSVASLPVQEAAVPSNDYKLKNKADKTDDYKNYKSNDEADENKSDDLKTDKADKSGSHTSDDNKKLKDAGNSCKSQPNLLRSGNTVNAVPSEQRPKSLNDLEEFDSEDFKDGDTKYENLSTNAVYNSASHALLSSTEKLDSQVRI